MPIANRVDSRGALAQTTIARSYRLDSKLAMIAGVVEQTRRTPAARPTYGPKKSLNKKLARQFVIARAVTLSIVKRSS